MYIIYAILAFSSLIIVHELGHFILAKINGVNVVEFSIGMGPKIVSIKGKETKYSIGILPIGGYVQMSGEDDAEEEKVDKKRTLNAKRPIQKILVMIAGVVMNVVLAITLFSILASHFGYQTPQIGEVIKNSPAQYAGLQNGDIIKSINDSKVITNQDISYDIAMSNGKPLKMEVERGNKIFNLDITPKLDKETKSYMIGIYFDGVENPTLEQSVKQGIRQSIGTIKQTYRSIAMLFSGKGSITKDVGGPVTIIRMTGEAAKMGILALMNLTAYLSINLAVVNLLPFPALDGGRCVMYLFEMITRIKVPSKIEGYINAVGFILLMGLMLFVTVKDILFPINL